jgi:hypothetical protein
MHYKVPVITETVQTFNQIQQLSGATKSFVGPIVGPIRNCENRSRIGLKKWGLIACSGASPKTKKPVIVAFDGPWALWCF